MYIYLLHIMCLLPLCRPVDGNLSVAVCNNSDILDPTMDATAGCMTADRNNTNDTLFVDCTTPGM